MHQAQSIQLARCGHILGLGYQQEARGCTGGFGWFNWGEWWGGFSEWMDPYLRFLAAFIVLSFFPVVVDLATGGWRIIPQILRLDSSSRQPDRLQRSQVVRTPVFLDYTYISTSDLHHSEIL